MKTTISFACYVLMFATMAWCADTLVLPDYEYELIGSLTKADMHEAFNIVQMDVEAQPIPTAPDTNPGEGIAAGIAVLNASMRSAYIIRSIAQSNQSVSVKIEALYPTGAEHAGKNYTLGRTNGHFVILNKSNWEVHDSSAQPKQKTGIQQPPSPRTRSPERQGEP